MDLTEGSIEYFMENRIMISSFYISLFFHMFLMVFTLVINQKQEVKPGSLASDAGLTARMVIQEINRQPIKSIAEFNQFRFF